MGTSLPYNEITRAQVGDGQIVRLRSKEKLFCPPWGVHGPGPSDFCPPGPFCSIQKLLTSSVSVTDCRNTSEQLHGDIIVQWDMS